MRRSIHASGPFALSSPGVLGSSFVHRPILERPPNLGVEHVSHGGARGEAGEERGQPETVEHGCQSPRPVGSNQPFIVKPSGEIRTPYVCNGYFCYYCYDDYFDYYITLWLLLSRLLSRLIFQIYFFPCYTKKKAVLRV
jgi:hypothetical protein